MLLILRALRLPCDLRLARWPRSGRANSTRILEKSMGLVQTQSRFDTLIENNRAGVRVNSRVPVIVEWEDAGQTSRIEGTTKDTGPHSSPLGQGPRSKRPWRHLSRCRGKTQPLDRVRALLSCGKRNIQTRSGLREKR